MLGLPERVTCPDCYEIGIMRLDDSPRLVDLCPVHASRWQPIETAPKNGTEILLAHGNSMWIDEWTMVNELDGFWMMCDQWETPEVPTHWMPLPVLPERHTS